ncbi:MAG: glycerophosphoryl diester phosphodiesterase [Alphaproteobacteria bacterium]|jgi:glycerophosphoryl diester phosphodiesterase|nr:glycerophosphoryl diester phosphodiesterase [Alphaproteobacteria bacterium]
MTVLQNAYPRIIGHRGAAALAPENTLASIRAAAAEGVTWIEVDSKLAGDNVPVLFHDETLDRTTNTTGRVADRTAAALAEIDAGSWFGPPDGPTFPGEPIPTLAQSLAEIRRLGLGLDLEIKPDKGRTVETATHSLEALSEAGFTSADPLLVTSFRPEAIRIFHTYAPEFARGLLIWQWPDDWLKTARALDCVAVISDQKSLATESDVREIIDAGFLAMTYTVNERARAEELLGWGVTSVVTDDPTVMRGL